jgi:nucleoside-diphosphate-sugar epimerase
MKPIVLLTGATGVLGSIILKTLIKENHNVICLKRIKSNILLVKDVYNKSIWYDVDYIDLKKIFVENKIDVIIHTATNYGRNYSEYFDAYTANVIMPIELLNLANSYGCSAFISTGTFFDKELHNISFDHELVYMDTYVKSKHIFEYIAQNNIKNMNMTFINMRLEHVYTATGDGKFVNYVVNSLRNNVKELELSEGSQKRDWIYVDDVVSAYLVVLKNLNNLQHHKYYMFEVGTGTSHSVREFVEMAKKIIDSNTVLLFGKYPVNSTELEESKADISNLQKFGWNPNFDLASGIKEVNRIMEI